MDSNSLVLTLLNMKGWGPNRIYSYVSKHGFNYSKCVNGLVEELNDELMSMGKHSTGSSVGTGGMETKLIAAKIATGAGADMVIANAKDVKVIHRIVGGKDCGTLFCNHKDENFDLTDFVDKLHG